MIKAAVVIGLLKSLETYVTRLESLRPASLEKWNEDFTNYWAALHGLQVAVQQDLGVDPAKVFTVMQNDLDDFRLFAEYIGDYLRREGII